MAGSPRRMFCAVGSLSALLGVSLVVGGLFALCSVVHCSRIRDIEPAVSMPSEVTVPMPSPGPHGVVHNEYRCAAASTQLSDGYIVRYEPRADSRLVHHMLLFGCRYPPTSGSWDCKSTAFLCGFGDSPQIIFAWALNASGLHMPKGVGLKVGPAARINYLVVQIHYGHPEDVPDLSTVSKETLIVHTTEQRQEFVAGIFLLGSGGSLKPKSKDASVYSACRFPGPKAIHPFAFRTHAHSLGKQIVGYVVKLDRTWEVIGTRSPQDAQAFYPVGKEVSVDPNNWLGVRCVFDTEHARSSVHMGPDSEDEMCNFYIMYYTTNDDVNLSIDSCWAPPPSSLRFPAKLPPLPTPSDEEEVGGEHSHMGTEDYHAPTPVTTPLEVTLPTSPSPPPRELPRLPNTTTPPPVSSGLVQSEDWPLNGFPIPTRTLGQITAVAIDNAGDVHILHRGPVTWDFDSFEEDYTYTHIDDGPIKVPTLLKFSSTTGRPDQAWGASLFYMPHGLTIDHEGNFWVTDVAMHQVFKFTAFGDSKPALVLGKAFKPGAGYGSFCQPTSVAVETSGSFYVTDGYCNHRVMKYNRQGKLAEVWEVAVAGLSLFVPHKAILNVANDILYVADRQNRRVVSFSTSEGGHGSVLSNRAELGGLPYAIAFNGSSDWPMYGVFGGHATEGNMLMGFTLDESGNRIGMWGPQEGFTRPHDLTVDTIHNAVYVTEIGPNKIWKFVPFPELPKDFSEDLDKVLHSDHSPATPDSAYTPHPSPLAVPVPSTTTSENIEKLEIDKESNSSMNVTENLEGSGNVTVQDGDTLINAHQPNSKEKPMAGVNVGVVVAVLAVVAVIALVVVGVLKEHRLIRFKGWRLLQAGERDKTIGITSSGTTTRREEEKLRKKKQKMTPQKKLQSLLGPSHLGFSRLKTYDSNSEDEEFPVFNRV